MRMFKKIFTTLCLSSLLFGSCAASAETAPKQSASAEIPKPVLPGEYVLAGSESGLYKIAPDKTVLPLWTEGKVTKIIKTPYSEPGSNRDSKWYFLTSKGVLTSYDLQVFELRNEGLPFLTIKQWDGVNVTFKKQIAQLKDLSVHPQNPNILVTATKENVYLTQDSGLTWQNIGSTSATTSGIKACAVATMENDLVVFMSHAIFGFSYKKIVDGKKTQWTDVSSGFESMQTQVYPDEISDILPVVFANGEGGVVTEIFVSQTFLPRLYRFNWQTKKAELLYKGKEPLDTIDGLFWDGNRILFSKPGNISSYTPKANVIGVVPQEYEAWKDRFTALSSRDTLYSAWVPNNRNGLELSEMWLLRPEQSNGIYANKALNRKAIYVPANKVCTPEGIKKYKKVITDNKLDALVIDMKDDYGLLRYNAKDPEVVEKGYISKYHIDLEQFVSEFKKNDDIYLIARIVVFKDKHLSEFNKGKYAIWDKAHNKPWMGTKKDGSYYDENWVDPYSPEVWKYVVSIAKELIAGGFDEIQFDYIRFPTDGINMRDAQFRWKSEGMDKESALLSFLSYARKYIDAPLGIDIYGANGWYRSGTRTGQDVEQLAEYVDVICPMFYPSHFEQGFLDYNPSADRPYRIYYYGTYRNTVIGRNNIIVRPWAQAFYLNVSYDRKYYDKNYVQKQIFGVRDSVGKGYMYWNNIARYDDLSPDIGDSPYTGKAVEASKEFRKPALSSGPNPDFKPANPAEEALKETYMQGGAMTMEKIPVEEQPAPAENEPVINVLAEEELNYNRADRSKQKTMGKVRKLWYNKQ